MSINALTEWQWLGRAGGGSGDASLNAWVLRPDCAAPGTHEAASAGPPLTSESALRPWRSADPGPEFPPKNEDDICFPY